jgi:hypothetical protein
MLDARCSMLDARRSVFDARGVVMGAVINVTDGGGAGRRLGDAIRCGRTERGSLASTMQSGAAARTRRARAAIRIRRSPSSLKSSAMCSAAWKAPVIDDAGIQQKNEYRHRDFFVAQNVAARVAW